MSTTPAPTPSGPELSPSALADPLVRIATALEELLQEFRPLLRGGQPAIVADRDRAAWFADFYGNEAHRHDPEVYRKAEQAWHEQHPD